SDFVRSLQRDARIAVSTTFTVIQGFDAYGRGNGNPGSISGLETPNRYTLQVHLSRVAGDLPYRFALPESAPIPPSPIDPSAQFSAATGHDSGYGPFLVASGPYMIAGSPQLDFSRPAAQHHQRDYQRAIQMNLAVPPFDDIHVRKAVNYILDKRALLDAHGGDLTGIVMTHYVVDSLEGGALSGYRPYATPNDMGSLELAM